MIIFFCIFFVCLFVFGFSRYPTGLVKKVYCFPVVGIVCVCVLVGGGGGRGQGVVVIVFFLLLLHICDFCGEGFLIQNFKIKKNRWR